MPKYTVVSMKNVLFALNDLFTVIGDAKALWPDLENDPNYKKLYRDLLALRSDVASKKYSLNFDD